MNQIFEYYTFNVTLEPRDNLTMRIALCSTRYIKSIKKDLFCFLISHLLQYLFI